MAGRRLSVAQWEEIQRLLNLGRGVREITRALKCSRKTIRKVKEGELASSAIPRVVADPLWMNGVDWPAVVQDLGGGHPLKFIYSERAAGLTSYANFWKQFYRKCRSRTGRR